MPAGHTKLSESTYGTNRYDREVMHGAYLSHMNAEMQWGWITDAGQKRAQRRAALLAESAGLQRGVRALEVGCGTGLFTERFARTECQLTAVDISPELIERAKQRLHGRQNVHFELCAVEKCRHLEPFDAVVGSSVLHHLDLRPALRVLRQLIKNGGRIAFAEPNHLNPQIFLERKFRRFFPYVSPDETAFFRHRIARNLADAGFKGIHVLPFDWLHPNTPTALISIVNRLGRIFERTPFIREFSGSLLITAGL